MQFSYFMYLTENKKVVLINKLITYVEHVIILIRIKIINTLMQLKMSNYIF